MPTYVDFLSSTFFFFLFFFVKGKRWYLNGILNAVQTGFLSFMELIGIETDVLAWLCLACMSHTCITSHLLFPRCFRFG